MNDLRETAGLSAKLMPQAVLQQTLMPRVLVVQEDDETRAILASILEDAGYTVETVWTGAQALKKIKETVFDLMLVEHVLPEMTAMDLIKSIRQIQNFPILLLTTTPEPEKIIEALNEGADDYMQKPFERACILNRVRSLLKRFDGSSDLDLQQYNQQLNHKEKFSIGQLVVDFKTYDVFSNGDRIQLTPSEFKLLNALAQNRGKVLTREKLIELVQGQGIAVIDRAIDTHIFGLRKKLGKDSEIVETVRGVGYRIN